jgi:hypothetical protein
MTQMKTGILKSLALSAVATGTLVAAMPQAEAARVVVGINNGYVQPVQQCDGYTRTYIDGYGYQRVVQGTACLQPNGEWIVVSEALLPLQSPRYPGPVVYRDVPSYYVRPTVIYYNDRNTRWSHDDHHDNGGRYNGGGHNGRHH